MEKNSNESLLNKINYDISAIDNVLVVVSSMTDSNMLQYLGILGQNTNIFSPIFFKYWVIVHQNQL